jgi:16S rRNA (uracil1498-N3)-methyltransferase
MSIPRFYCPIPLLPGREASLPEAVGRHAQSALRLRVGDSLILFNGEGGECLAVLERGGREARARVLECRAVARESPLAVTLAQGISSGERMDYTLQKAVELGVTAVQPIVTRRTVVRLDDERRQRRRAHWLGVVMSACEQCGRCRLPAVGEILEYPDWIVSSREMDGVKFLLDPEGGLRLRDLPAPGRPVLLLAGPEGGFEPVERETALAAGFIPLRLGPRILRTETAAVAALAAMQALWGDS